MFGWVGSRLEEVTVANKGLQRRSMELICAQLKSFSGGFFMFNSFFLIIFLIKMLPSRQVVLFALCRVVIHRLRTVYIKVALISVPDDCATCCRLHSY